MVLRIRVIIVRYKTGVSKSLPPGPQPTPASSARCATILKPACSGITTRTCTQKNAGMGPSSPGYCTGPGTGTRLLLPDRVMGRGGPVYPGAVHEARSLLLTESHGVGPVSAGGVRGGVRGVGDLLPSIA